MGGEERLDWLLWREAGFLWRHRLSTSKYKHECKRTKNNFFSSVYRKFLTVANELLLL